jgi:hypothetical protein
MSLLYLRLHSKAANRDIGKLVNVITNLPIDKSWTTTANHLNYARADVLCQAQALITTDTDFLKIILMGSK